MTSWSDFAVNGPERAVRWSVRRRQCLGLKQAHAFEETGTALGLTARYVRGIVHGDLHLSGQLWRQIKHRWWADMDRQAAEFRALATQIEEEAETARLAEQQLMLPFGETKHDRTTAGEDRPVALAQNSPAHKR